MSKVIELHPTHKLHNEATQLREQTTFAAKQASNHARHAQQASQDLASLDMEGIFAQLREMVRIVGGKHPANDAKAVAPSHAISKAAE